MSTEGPQIIVPRYKMIMMFDVLPGNYDSYYQFILGEMIPAMQEMSMYMTEAWHTAYGDYPLRMASFVAESYSVIDSMLSSDRWKELENRLLAYVHNYSRCVVEYRRGFQFVR